MADQHGNALNYCGRVIDGAEENEEEWDIFTAQSFLFKNIGQDTPWLTHKDQIYRQVSNIRRTLEGDKIVDHSALLHLHLHSQLNTWLQWVGQRQLHDETRII